MKKWYEKGIIGDLKGAWKSCLITTFLEDTEEIARESVKQYIERSSNEKPTGNNGSRPA